MYLKKKNINILWKYQIISGVWYAQKDNESYYYWNIGFMLVLCV
jgi:hypothetical protein